MTKGLQDLGVNVKLQTRVVHAQEVAYGGHELTLSNGSQLKADLYLPTYGVVANTSYLSAKLVNAHGFIKVDEYLRVGGSSDVWAAGDVCEVEASQFLSCDRQSSYVARAIVAVLRKKTPPPYKAMASSE